MSTCCPPVGSNWQTRTSPTSIMLFQTLCVITLIYLGTLQRFLLHGPYSNVWLSTIRLNLMKLLEFVLFRQAMEFDNTLLKIKKVSVGRGEPTPNFRINTASPLERQNSSWWLNSKKYSGDYPLWDWERRQKVQARGGHLGLLRPKGQLADHLFEPRFQCV